MLDLKQEVSRWSSFIYNSVASSLIASLTSTIFIRLIRPWQGNFPRHFGQTTTQKRSQDREKSPEGRSELEDEAEAVLPSAGPHLPLPLNARDLGHHVPSIHWCHNRGSKLPHHKSMSFHGTSIIGVPACAQERTHQHSGLLP